MVNGTQKKGATAIVLFHPPSMPFQHFLRGTAQECMQVLNDNLSPHLIRGMILPNRISSSPLDNDHEECTALLLLDEMLPLGAPCFVIMDSGSEQGCYAALRDNEPMSAQHLMRHVYAGVSKILVSQVH